MRLPYAAKQLMREVAHIDEGALSTPVVRPDGLGVWRSIAFDVETSAWLEPALRACADERIVSLVLDEDRLIVTFRPDISADETYPFGVRAADDVLRGDD